MSPGNRLALRGWRVALAVAVLASSLTTLTVAPVDAAPLTLSFRQTPLEEVFEMLTWAQLGFHAKPIGLLDVESYYQPLARMLQAGVDEGFMKAENRSLLLHADSAIALLAAMNDYQPPSVTRQIHDERQL